MMGLRLQLQCWNRGSQGLACAKDGPGAVRSKPGANMEIAIAVAASLILMTGRLSWMAHHVPFIRNVSDPTRTARPRPRSDVSHHRHHAGIHVIEMMTMKGPRAGIVGV